MSLGIINRGISLDNPIQFKGAINTSTSFPLLTVVEKGWFYKITANCIDNDPTKTNTGQSFVSGDEIVWDSSVNLWVETGSTDIFTDDGTSVNLANDSRILKVSEFAASTSTGLNIKSSTLNLAIFIDSSGRIGLGGKTNMSQTVEVLGNFDLSNGSSGKLSLKNNTGVSGQFCGALIGVEDSDSTGSQIGLSLIGQVDLDFANKFPAVLIDGRNDGSSLASRLIFGIGNYCNTSTDLKLNVSAAGNVAIGYGDTNCAQKLEVNGTIKSSGIMTNIIQAKSASGLYFYDDALTITSGFFLRDGGQICIGTDTSSGAKLNFGISSGCMIQMSPETSSAVFIGHYKGDALTFNYLNGQMLNSTANLNFVVDTNNISSKRYVDFGKGTADYSATSLMRIIETGNIGINLTTPKATFHIAKSAAPNTITASNCYLQIGASEYNLNTYRLIGFGYNNLTTQTFPCAYMGYQETVVSDFTRGDLVFGCKNTSSDSMPNEILRLTGVGTGGRVGINKSVPNYELDVDGNISMSGTSLLMFNNAAFLYRDSTTSIITEYRTHATINIKFGDTYAISVDSNRKTDICGTGGCVILSATLEQNYAFEMPNNTAQKAKANAWDIYSDTRIKLNQIELDYGLDQILGLKPKRYDQCNSKVKQNEDKTKELIIDQSGVKTIGLIAQEVYEVIPEAVNKPSDDTFELWGLNDSKLLPVIINSIKELKAKIDDVNIEIENIKTMIDEKRLSKINLIIDKIGSEDI